MPDAHLSLLLYQLGQRRIAVKAFGIITFNSSFFGAVSKFLKISTLFGGYLVDSVLNLIDHQFTLHFCCRCDPI